MVQMNVKFFGDPPPPYKNVNNLYFRNSYFMLKNVTKICSNIKEKVKNRNENLYLNF